MIIAQVAVELRPSFLTPATFELYDMTMKGPGSWLVADSPCCLHSHRAWIVCFVRTQAVAPPFFQYFCVNSSV